MKRFFVLLIAVLLFTGCSSSNKPTQVVATTLPVYEFTNALCENTEIAVMRLITEEVSCLHDFSLQVTQMQALESAQLVVFSGAGLDDFMIRDLPKEKLLDASAGISLHCVHEDDHDHGHNHEQDPHIWLSIQNARQMANTIYRELVLRYPMLKEQFTANMESLTERFNALESYASEKLTNISGKEIITFHDGFSYLAEQWDIHIVHAIEEESGSEASAAELKHIIQLVDTHSIPALFTEAYGSVSAARIISAETGIPCYQLDMAMSGDSWFSAMEHNIDTLKEALE